MNLSRAHRGSQPTSITRIVRFSARHRAATYPSRIHIHFFVRERKKSRGKSRAALSRVVPERWDVHVSRGSRCTSSAPQSASARSIMTLCLLVRGKPPNLTHERWRAHGQTTHTHAQTAAAHTKTLKKKMSRAAAQRQYVPDSRWFFEKARHLSREVGSSRPIETRDRDGVVRQRRTETDPKTQFGLVPKLFQILGRRRKLHAAFTLSLSLEEEEEEEEEEDSSCLVLLSQLSRFLARVERE